MATVQRGCRSKKATSSSRRSLRLSWTSPCASTPWRWKMDLAVSMPIMLMLIAGGSLDAGPDDRTLAHRCRWGPSTPAVNQSGKAQAGRKILGPSGLPSRYIEHHHSANSKDLQALKGAGLPGGYRIAENPHI